MKKWLIIITFLAMLTTAAAIGFVLKDNVNSTTFNARRSSYDNNKPTFKFDDNRLLMEAASLLGIDLIDHIIVGRDDFISIEN